MPPLIQGKWCVSIDGPTGPKFQMKIAVHKPHEAYIQNTPVFSLFHSFKGFESRVLFISR